jgi:hypothetical protein
MNLTEREKQFLTAGAILFGLIVFVQVFIRPTFGRIKRLKSLISDKQKVLNELRNKSEQYKTISRELNKVRLEIGRRPEERKILSFVERIQKDANLMQKVVYMKPSTMIVDDIYERIMIDIKLQNITLDQLIQFLLKIESSELAIGFKRLDIKRAAQYSNLLDTTIQLVSLSSIRPD